MAADDVVSLRGEANLDDIVRELERIQTELDLVQKKGHEEILIDAEVQAALEEVERLKRAVDQVGTEDEKVQIDAEIGPATQKLQELSTTYRQRLDEMRRQQTPFEALGRDAREETTRAIRRLRELEREFRAATNRMRRAADDVDFDPASDSARRLQSEVRASALAMIRHLDGLDPEIRQKVEGFNDVRRAVRALKAELAGIDNQDLGNGRQQLGKLETAFRNVQLAANAFFASIIVDRVARFGREVVNASAALQDMERSYAALFGSQEEGNRQMERAEELARLLGLSLSETRLSFRNFVVSAQEAGFEAETAAAIYESLAIAAKGIGGSQQEASNAMRAFTQVISKGKIQAEELRGQLGDALPGSLSILAKEMGKTTQELDKMLEQGELTTDQLIELSNGMLKVFGPAALANIEGTRAEMDRFRTALGKAAEIIGGELSEQVALFLQDLNLMGEDGEAQARRLGEAVGNAAELVRRDLTLIGDILRGDWAAAWNQARATVASFASSVASIMGRLIGTLAEIVATPFEGMAQAAALALEGVRRAAVEMLDFLAEKLPAGFGKAAAGAAEELRGLEGVFEQTVENIDGAAERFGDRWREAGSEVAEVLDGIGEKLEEQARTSRGTTDEQIGHQEELQDKLEELRKLFEDLINARKEGAKEVTEAERKEMDKQLKFFADFADKVRDLLSGAGEIEIKPTGAGAPQAESSRGAGQDAQQVSELEQNLAAARAEKERLESQPILSLDDINRITDLIGIIADLESQVQAAGSAMSDALGNFGRDPGVGNFGAGIVEEFDEAATQVEARGEQMTELLTELIGSEAFGDAFSGLDAAAQSRIRSLIQDFLEIQETVGATEEDIRVYTEAIIGELGRAGVGVGKLGEEFGDLDVSAVDRAREALDALGSGSEEAGDKAGEMGDKLDGAAVKIEETADGIRIFTEEAESAGEAAGEAGDRAESAAEGIEQAGEAADGAAEGMESAGEAAGEAGEKMEEAGEGAKNLQEHIEAMGGDVVEAGIKIEGTGEKITIFKDGVEQTGEAAEETGIRIEGTGDKIEILGQKAEESGEKVKGAGEAAKETAEPMEQLGAAAEKAAEPMKGVAEAADKIASSEGAPENLRGIAEAAEEAVEPVSAVRDAAAEFADALERIGQSETAEEIRRLIVALEDSSEPFGTATEAASPFAELMAKLSEVIGTAADELTRTVEQLRAFSELVESAAALLEEGRLQEGLAALAEALTEASPSFEAAAGHLSDMADAVSRISETVQAASDGLTAFAETSAEISEGGQIQALTEAFEALLEKTEGVSADLVEVADALQRVADIQEDVTAAAEAIGESIGEMASEERIGRLRDMSQQIEKIRKAIGEADQKARALKEGMAELTGEVEKATGTWGDFAEKMSGAVAQGLSQVRTLVNAIRRALGSAASAASETVDALMRLESTIPSIEATAAAVSALTSQLQAAAAAAGELKNNLAGVSL